MLFLLFLFFQCLKCNIKRLGNLCCNKIYQNNNRQQCFWLFNGQNIKLQIRQQEPNFPSGILQTFYITTFLYFNNQYQCRFRFVYNAVQISQHNILCKTSSKMINNDNSSTINMLKSKGLLPKQQPKQLNNRKFIYPDVRNTGNKKFVLNLNDICAYAKFNNKGLIEDQQAIIIYPNGSYFFGNVTNGIITGSGKLTNEAAGYSYDGTWHKNLPEGVGQQIINSNVFNGNFLEGKKNGKGTLKFQDGTYYQGSFMNNEISGFGVYKTDEFQWKGIWKGGCLEGEGTQIIKNKNGKKNSVYNGNFNKGVRQGEGKYAWDSNRLYEGSFKKGQLHGKGTLRLGNMVYKGKWQQGEDLQINQIGQKSSTIQFKKIESFQIMKEK